MKKHKKKHELLPKKLPYLRELGKRKRKPTGNGGGSDTEASGAPASDTGLPTRWATDYCWKRADKPGSCSKGKDCAFKHMAEGEAKKNGLGFWVWAGKGE